MSTGSHSPAYSRDDWFCGSFARQCVHQLNQGESMAWASGRERMQDAGRTKRSARGKDTVRERHFRDLLEALPAAVYATDAAGRITFYNPAAAEIAGRTPALGKDEWWLTSRLYWPHGAP